MLQYNTACKKYWRTFIPDQQTAELGSLINAMEGSGTAPDSDSLATVAKSLAKLFGVDPDEVAILKVVPKYKSLKFVLPAKLTPVGTIPLPSTTALAARTARERKPELANNFSSARRGTPTFLKPFPSDAIQAS